MSFTPPSRILHVVDTLEFGGLERVVADLAIAQAAQGRQVEVFSLNDTRGFRPMLEAAGVPVVVGAKRGTLDLRMLSALRHNVSSNAVQVVHTHNFVPNYYAALATRFVAHPPALVNTCHNMGTRLSNRRLRWLYRWSLRHTARIALVGRQVRDRLVETGVAEPGKADVVLNGVPVPATTGDRDAARDRLGIPRDALLLGSVGRLVALKNHRLLLDAMPGLLAKHPRLHAVIVGDGPLQPELQRQIDGLGLARHIHLAGPRNDVQALLPAFDVFVLPSRTEGLSIALLEACAAGLAVVATDVGGNGEIIADQSTGRLVPSDDLPALQDAVGALLHDRDGRRRLGGAAREWVRMHGSVDAMRQNYDTVYARALDARR
ncbi:glycosyltransferase [Luteimonas aestuarii]|nr:glycosyltransferase [Luteimonas aestuarii]